MDSKMNVETKKVPIFLGSQSMIGTGNERPVFWGNYFWLIIDHAEYRVLNMWAENLEHAAHKYLHSDNVQVRLYTYTFTGMQPSKFERVRRWCLVDDERIPKEYYYNKLCFTGGYLPSEEVAKDMYEHVGDPDYEFEQFVDPISYHAKRGRTYDPKTGIVTYGRVSPGGIVIPSK